jgi:hypothetical protein
MFYAELLHNTCFIFHYFCVQFCMTSHKMFIFMSCIASYKNTLQKGVTTWIVNQHSLIVNIQVFWYVTPCWLLQLMFWRNCMASSSE